MWAASPNYSLLVQLGDFGLVRMGSNANHTQTAAITTNVIGTSAYMAPEAYRGDVSVKMDVFSFGVVSYLSTNIISLLVLAIEDTEADNKVI